MTIKIVRCNQDKIEAFVQMLKDMPDRGRPFNSYSYLDANGGCEFIIKDMYPSLNHPGAVDFFFFVGAQEFGNWYGNHHGYVEPIYGQIDGVKFKGSDLLYKMTKRALDHQEDFFSPANIAALTPKEFADLMSDDNGPIPYPNWEDRYVIATALAQDFLRRGSVYATPLHFIEFINGLNEGSRLREFLYCMLEIPGFKSDVLQKKGLLLAMVLANRPEHFLAVKPDSSEWRPIVDYHLMRLCLRLGLIEFISDYDQKRNIDRRWISSGTEGDIRGNTYKAVVKLIDLSGKTMAFIDELMWSARSYCPEMSEPQCENCKLNSVCARRTELFQPIFRTTNY